jgi:predicted RNA-binding protein associated with RNAse of E/G family
LRTESLITEVKHQLDGQIKTFECEVLSRTEDELVIYYKMKTDYSLHGVELKKGMISLGYFWPDRFYNLYHWVDSEGQSIALYFNICDSTQLTENKVEWRDLVVDVLMTDSGPAEVLDEDELPDDIDTNTLQRINSTRDYLCANQEGLVKEFSHCSHSIYQQLI